MHQVVGLHICSYDTNTLVSVGAGAGANSGGGGAASVGSMSTYINRYNESNMHVAIIVDGAGGEEGL
jgi:hypothetical protein